MKRLLLSLLLLAALLLSGCSRENQLSAPRTEAQALANEAQRARTSAFLAYQHWLTLDTEAQKVATVFEAAQVACNKAADGQCAILESHIATGRDSRASLKLRASPKGIRAIVAALGQQATVTNQSTTAEDLQAPIADAARQREMLKDYRAKLETLREKAGNDVDALIKIQRELAQTQSELETIEGTHARLMQRVETEILTISIESTAHRAFWPPIGFALADFGEHLSDGISSAITGIAYLLPWAVILILAVFGIRALWRRGKRKAP